MFTQSPKLTLAVNPLSCLLGDRGSPGAPGEPGFPGKPAECLIGLPGLPGGQGATGPPGRTFCPEMPFGWVSLGFVPAFQWPEGAEIVSEY